MSILIIGRSGQIGHELMRELARFGTIAAPTRQELDLADPASVRNMVRHIRPTLVVNAAGYTAVDRAESEPELCARINADGPALLAAECRRLGSVLVHLSTDYVFGGDSRVPYLETDPPAPCNVYGRTKLAGEEGVAAAGGAYLIVRTSWVYGARGQNFPRTMLRLARERDALDVVADQTGAPTSAAALARGVSEVLRTLVSGPDWFAACEAAAGVYHMTAEGSTTWYEFARMILADDPFGAEQICREVRPIASANYPAAARRPLYTVLDNEKLEVRFGVRLAPWIEQWRTVVEQLRVSGRPTSLVGAEPRPADRSTE